MEHYNSVTHPFYDNCVFEPFKAFLGGRIRLMISGSAPISTQVLNFLRIAFCVQILEGYGQTECGAPTAISWSNDTTSGHVGGPFPTLEIKLVDSPPYFTDHAQQDVLMPQGELCYRGSSVCAGYFRQKEIWKQTLVDGWVHSGDIAMLCEGGRIKIIDRKSNIFKIS